MIGTYLTDRITVFHPTGYDELGTPTGVTTEDVPARVEYGNRMIRAPSGEQVVSRAVITTRHPVVVGDTITLPDGTSGQALDVRPIAGLGGRESHREVYL